MVNYADLVPVPCEEDVQEEDSQRVQFYVGDPFSNEWREDFAVRVLEFCPTDKDGKPNRCEAEVLLDYDLIGCLFRKSIFWYADKLLSLALGKNSEIKFSTSFVRTGRMVATQLCPRFQKIVDRARAEK